MKYPSSATNQPVALSSKLSATFSEGFVNQYNSPKTVTAKGFIMPKTQKRDSSKSKAIKANNSSVVEASRRSSSKQKCDTLRTVSNSPKSALIYKSESVRREDTTYAGNQQKYKKLEITTDFNTKSSLTNKAQTTKYINTDESYAIRFPTKTPQSATKVKQNNNSYTCYTELNQPDRENSLNRVSYRKDKTASPKAVAAPAPRPLSAKVNKDESERAVSKETQQNPLMSFVTRMNKGETFSSIKKAGEKRDSSARRTQKPQLNIESKPVRAVDLDLKGSKTTTNVSLGKGPASPKTNKKGTKEVQKVVQENVVRAKAQGKEPFVYYMTHLDKAHKWTGEADYFVQTYQEHFLQSFHVLSILKGMKQPDPVVLAQKRVNFPQRDSHKGKRTLVFDMDETLIHCNESLDMPADVILPIVFPTGEVVEAGINVRPYAIEMLRELSQHFEIMVFTASQACYANVVLDYLDPNQELIHHRLFRESCIVSEEGLHIKDLRVIGNRNLEDLILIDNAAYSYSLQLENGIPIIPFYDNKADQELRNLTPYLKFLGSVKDIREVNKQTFKLHHYFAHDEAEELLESMISN